MNDDIRALDEDLKAQFAILDRAREEMTCLRELRNEALDEHLATLTDEAIMGDDTLLRTLLREAEYHRGASKLMRRLHGTGRQDVVAEGMDGREEYAGESFPALQVRLDYRQDTAPVAACLRAWAAVWALGRASLSVGILEQTLSRWASWKLVWDLEADTCEVRSSNYGRAEMEGTLEEALQHVATKLWYQGGPATYRDEYDG